MHSIILAHGTKKQHEKFHDWLMSRRYPLEGKFRKGYAKPSVSELKLWDIRIPEECYPYMKKDLKKNVGLAYDVKFKKGGSEFISMRNFMTWVIKFIQFVTPFKSPGKWLKKHKIPENYTPVQDLPGWYQVKEIGCMPDPKDFENREVL